VREGDSGRLFTPGSVEQLTNRLDLLSRNDAERQRLAAAGQVFVRANFSRAASINAMADLYQRYLAKVGVA
jgi:glycosyltransferase involved in cell wall biosynthesis